MQFGMSLKRTCPSILTVLHCTVLFSFVFYCAVLYCVVSNYILLYCIVLCCFHLYCTVLHCTVLFSVVFYCAVLYRICFRRIQRERGSGVHYRWIADFLRHRLLCSLRSLLPRYAVPTPVPCTSGFPCQSLSAGGQTSHVDALIVTVCHFTNVPFHSVSQKTRETHPSQSSAGY